MRDTWIFLLLIAALWACDSGSTEEEATQQQQQTETTASEAQAAESPAGTVKYPSIPLDTIKMLYEKCDYIDYVFYYSNISANQSQQADIRSALSHVAEQPPAIKASCKPIGRVFYQVEGENRAEADLYIGQGCNYYLWYEDGQPAYANQIMDSGINFIKNLLAQTSQGKRSQ